MPHATFDRLDHHVVGPLSGVDELPDAGAHLLALASIPRCVEGMGARGPHVRARDLVALALNQPRGLVSRVASTGARAIIGTSSAMAWLTAVPIAPEELSTFSSAGESRSMKATAPSAASTDSVRATCLISETASRIRTIARYDFQPNAWRRNRALNCHLRPVRVGMTLTLP